VCRTNRLAQIARRKQAVAPVLAIDQQNIDVAMKAAMLKAVVEKMDGQAFESGRSASASTPAW
jgi:hypothetical protein